MASSRPAGGAAPTCGGGIQAPLFELDPPTPAAGGYSGREAAAAAGITYRQLDHWARTGLVQPSLRPAQGSGSHRLYSVDDIVTLTIVRRLFAAGIAAANVRAVCAALAGHPVEDLAGRILVSDGVHIYLSRAAREVAELVRGGRAIFGLNLSQVLADTHAALLDAPVEALPDGPVAGGGSRQSPLRIVG